MVPTGGISSVTEGFSVYERFEYVGWVGGRVMKVLVGFRWLCIDICVQNACRTESFALEYCQVKVVYGCFRGFVSEF